MPRFRLRHVSLYYVFFELLLYIYLIFIDLNAQKEKKYINLQARAPWRAAHDNAPRQEKGNKNHQESKTACDEHKAGASAKDERQSSGKQKKAQYTGI
jgi:hypothetical protein